MWNIDKVRHIYTDKFAGMVEITIICQYEFFSRHVEESHLPSLLKLNMPV